VSVSRKHTLSGGELERIRKLLKTSLQNRGLDKALAKRKAAQLIRKLDSRGDGTITLEEVRHKGLPL